MLTIRAGAEVTYQVGQPLPFGRLGGRRVRDGLGHRLGAAVELHGTPPVGDPRRAGADPGSGCRRALLSVGHAGALDHLRTSLVNLDRRIVIDLFEGRSTAKLQPMVRRAFRAAG